MLRKSLALFFLFFLKGFSALVFSQNVPATRFAQFINADIMRKHLYIIASDSMEGRETGTRGLERAGNYIAKQFESAGLAPGNEDSFFQDYTLNKTDYHPLSFILNNEPLINGKDYYTSPKSGRIAIESEQITVAGLLSKCIPDTSLVKDKTLLILDDISGKTNKQSEEFRKKINNLKGMKPAAIIIAQKQFRKKVKISKWYARLNSSKLSIDEPDTSHFIPVIYMSDKKTSSVLKKSGSNATVFIKASCSSPVTLSVKAEIHRDAENEKLTARNVIGLIRGSEFPDEYIFVTAHYDHLGKNGDVIYYGADDDGSGTTSVITLAEAFGEAKKAGVLPRRSIVFLTNSGEEKGLLGSEYYTRHPVYPLDSTIVDLNIDMVGRVDNNHKIDSAYICLIGADMLSTELKAISESTNDKYTNLSLDYRYDDPKDANRFYYRSDHYNFAKNNIPVIFYFNGTHEDYHQPTDTPDKISYELMARRAQLVFYTAWELANRDQRIKADKVHEQKKL